jgi:hypothetical protein
MNNTTSDENVPDIIDECVEISGYDVQQAKACIRAAIRKANLGICDFCRKEVVTELDAALKHLE